ncbi:MAG: hypothetical protein IJQ23_05590 [Clostridia bacterium]|nr:hypothetical protein [Clostridia bacterium]
MKAVMISIKPKWVEKMVSGEKTIEVRKTVPKLETPFKCFIYCSKGARFNHKENKDMRQHWIRLALEHTQGKVIGEFICDYIIKAERGHYVDLVKAGCRIDGVELLNYADDKPLYGLHISDLKIYDNPKEITSFYKCPRVQCDKCYGEIMNERLKKYGRCAECLRLTRPPQSWCYMEVIG